jgi:hypothetical protein
MRARVAAILTALALLGGSGAALAVAQADGHSGSNAVAAQYAPPHKKHHKKHHKCKKGKKHHKKHAACKKHHKKHHK